MFNLDYLAGVLLNPAERPARRIIAGLFVVFCSGLGALMFYILTVGIFILGECVR